jgi:hypothetical protein
MEKLISQTKQPKKSTINLEPTQHGLEYIPIINEKSLV